MKSKKRELNEVHLGPNAELIENQAKKIRQFVFANGIFEIKIKPKDEKQHGGSREGSGRKKKPDSEKKEPTKVMRVPVSKVEEVKTLIK